jgi:hypothetical protein
VLLRPVHFLAFAAVFSLGCTPPPPPPQAPTTVTLPVAAAAAPEIVGYHCDGNPFHIGDRDYCAYDIPSSWREAQRACDAISARLISFGSEAQARAITEAFGPAIEISAEAFWIGLFEPAENEGQWQWIDGTRATYTHWNQGEPNDTDEAEDCAEWKLGTGSWNDAPCFVGRKYICQQRGNSPITCEGTRLHTTTGDICFSSEALDWEDAKQACYDNGGQLLALPTKEKDESLHKAVGPKLGMHAVWIGYNDIAHEGEWRWVSGARHVFYAWKDGEPNDFRDDEDCAEWYPEDGLMNDLSCSSKRPYICERLPN